MSFSFGGTTTTASNTFGTTTPSTGFSFGSGDAAKPLFGGAANTTVTKPGSFNFTSPTASGTQAQGNTFGGFGFSPGAKTTAATSSLFASPTTTNSGQATFGAAKPLGFGGPPNQTVGSPGFGQPAQQAQSTPFAMTSQQTTAPPAFGTLQTSQAAAPGFSTPAPAGSGFGGFGKPAQTGAPTGFGFTTPASGFSAPAQPPAQVTSIASSQAPPAFGQATSFGAKPGSFSFGGAPAATTAAPAFGTSAPAFGTSAPAFGTSAPAPAPAPAPSTGLTFGAGNTGMGFGLSAQPTGGLSFANPTTAAPTSQALSFGQPAQPTVQPTAQTSQPGQLGINFTATAQPSFGQPASQPGVFGTQPATQAGMNFGQATSQPTGITGFGTTAPTTGISFGTASTVAATTTPAVQSTGLNFGAPVSSASVSAAPSFGTPASTASKAPGLFGAPASTAVPTTGLSFGTPSTAPTTGLNFGTTPATSAVPAPTTGLSFGTAPASSAAGLSFNTATSTGLGFGTKLPTSSAAPTSSAPSGITSLVKSTAATTMPSLTTTTTAPLVPPQQISTITFAELEENINKWTLELEEQEKTFINQATQINAWDKLLIANGEKIVELNEVVQTVKNEQQSLEHELDFVVVQQKELEDLLAPMEKQLENSGDRVRDPEREKMYTLAENLDSQLKQMSEDLKEVIEHLNETNRGQDSNDPIVQIGRILNTHMSSMQWIDNSINQISNKLDQLKATHDTLRRENERSFQLTYN